MPDNGIPPGSVVIRPADMYDKIVATNESVQRLELVLTPAVQGMEHQVSRLAERVDSLEKFKWIVIGVSAGLGGTFGGVIGAVVK